MAIVCRNQRYVQLALHAVECLAHRLIGLKAMVLHLEKEVALAEHVLEDSGAPFGLFVLSSHQVLVQFPGKAAGETDQAFSVSRKKFLGDSRLAIKAMQR